MITQKNFDEKYIRENLESAKKQSEKLLDSDESNIWYRYFYALSEGYISYFEAINGSWFAALTTGINSISEFEKILSSDENFFEAYIAIGTFEYWKSRKLEFVSWLPFSNDTKSIGIDLLIIAIDSSSYNSHLAVNSLIWIYIDQKKYEECNQCSTKRFEGVPAIKNIQMGYGESI